MTLRFAAPLALSVLLYSSCISPQTAHSTPARHRAARAAAAKSTCPPTAVVNPPGVPAVTGSVQTAYSLHFVDTKIGTGALAIPGQIYSVHYTGWLTDGTKFDSSVDRGEPIEFPQGQHRVITGWDTGFAGMHIGGKRRLYIPYQLAYGENGKGPIPAKATLVFDVELVGQHDANTPPAAAPEPQKPQ